jgi:hypothetical protein
MKHFRQFLAAALDIQESEHALCAGRQSRTTAGFVACRKGWMARLARKRERLCSALQHVPSAISPLWKSKTTMNP